MWLLRSLQLVARRSNATSCKCSAELCDLQQLAGLVTGLSPPARNRRSSTWRQVATRLEPSIILKAQTFSSRPSKCKQPERSGNAPKIPIYGRLRCAVTPGSATTGSSAFTHRFRPSTMATLFTVRCDRVAKLSNPNLSMDVSTHSSLIIQHSSSTESSALIIQHSIFSTHHSSFIIHHSAFTALAIHNLHHSSFSIDHSAFTALIIRHSALVIQHSSLTSSIIHHSPSTTQQAGCLYPKLSNPGGMMSGKASLSSLVLEVGWNVTGRTVRPRLHSTL